MTTEQVIQDMLTENTGTHMLDSGGSNGRSWQRNQGLDFSESKRCIVDFSYGEINVTKSVFHHCVDTLEYSEEMQERYDSFVSTPDRDDTYHMQDMEEFVDQLDDINQDTRFSFNTYNGECNLSQTLQGVIFEYDSCQYVLLQIHGGADVRGGYTAPKCFEIDDNCGSFLSFADGYISCPNGHNWYTDDNYHFYADGACGIGAGKQLEEYEVKEIELDQVEQMQQELSKYKELVPDSNAPRFTDSDNNGYCPICGELLGV